MAAQDSTVTSRKRLDLQRRDHKQDGHVQGSSMARGTRRTASTMPNLKPPGAAQRQSAASTTFDVLRIWSPILVLIFGGCCSNVYTLESLVQASPSSGPLITAVQFIVAATFTLPNHLSFSRGWRNLYLKPRSIPLKKWLIYTAFFLTINILNNSAFNYRISVPLHIILRSAGPVTTMAIGHLVGKRTYPIQKVMAVLLLFVGVVCAAVSDCYAKQPQAFFSFTSGRSKSGAGSGLSLYLTQASGLTLITLALLLSAVMGLYTDTMYATYGRSTHIISETLFYSHALSLPFFALQYPTLTTELSSLTQVSNPVSNFIILPEHATYSLSHKYLAWALASFQYLLSAIPATLPLLLANAATQFLCISGVNRLSAVSSSLTVGIVLNVRKLVSLVLSIWLFGNRLPVGVVIGGVIVFVGGGLYALPVQKVASVPQQANGGADVGTNKQQRKKEL